MLNVECGVSVEPQAPWLFSATNQRPCISHLTASSPRSRKFVRLPLSLFLPFDPLCIKHCRSLPRILAINIHSTLFTTTTRSLLLFTK